MFETGIMKRFLFSRTRLFSVVLDLLLKPAQIASHNLNRFKSSTFLDKQNLFENYLSENC